jgi:protoporphyrinogen oxidase
MKKQKTIAILGAGITGLVAAYYLSRNYKVILLEKEKFVGGTAASFSYKDYILDSGPHKLYTELPGIMSEIEKVTPLLKIRKKNSIFLKGTFFDFPLQLKQIALKIPFTALNAGFDIILKTFQKLPDDSYENFLINRFGKTLYNLSFRDYALKVWGSNPQDLDRELAKRRVAVSSVFELIKSVIFKDAKKISAEYFYYPKNGMKHLFDSIVKKIRGNGGKIITNAKASEIRISDKQIDYIKVGKFKLKADYMISTIPLDSLSGIISPKITNPDLKYQKLNILYLILKKERALKDCWIFFPEKKFIFQRISEQKAFSAYTSPKNKTCLMVETTKLIDNQLISGIISQLEQIGVIKKEEIEEYFVKTIEKAYPIYKKGFLENLQRAEKFFESIKNFYLLGRQGLFNYNNMDQCWDMEMKAADQIKNNKSKEEWQRTKRYFENYRIVD